MVIPFPSFAEGNGMTEMICYLVYTCQFEQFPDGIHISIIKNKLNQHIHTYVFFLIFFNIPEQVIVLADKCLYTGAVHLLLKCYTIKDSEIMLKTQKSAAVFDSGLFEPWFLVVGPWTTSLPSCRISIRSINTNRSLPVCFVLPQ